MNYIVLETTEGEKLSVGVLTNVDRDSPEGIKRAIERSLAELSFYYGEEVKESDCVGFERMGNACFEVTVAGEYTIEFIKTILF